MRREKTRSETRIIKGELGGFPEPDACVFPSGSWRML